MLRNVEIKVDLESLNKSINITGIIYFEIDFYRYYPDENWSDFVVIILSWWIKSMKALILSKIGRTYEFNFMDGSPVVLAKKISNEDIELTCYDEGILICNIKQLRDSLLSTSKKVLREIDRKKWESDEIEELQSLTISLERYPF